MGDINFGASLLLTAGSTDKYDIFLARINNTTGTGDDEDFGSGVSLFPNPAADEIQLKGFSREMKYITYDVLGNVMSQGIMNEPNKISVENLERGIYFIELIAVSDSRKSTRIKFIKS